MAGHSLLRGGGAMVCAVSGAGKSGFGDGRKSKWKLLDIKNIAWHLG